MSDFSHFVDHDDLADAALTPEQRAYWLKFRAAHIKLQERVATLQRQQSEAPLIASTILSRPEFNREVARLLALDERYGGTSSLLYFTCENLDRFSAAHGEAQANHFMRSFCEVAIRHVRACDIVGRLATNELGIFLVRCNNDDAWRKGDSLLALLQQTLEEMTPLTPTLTLGYGAYSFAARETIANGLQQAAMAMLNRPDPR